MAGQLQSLTFTHGDYVVGGKTDIDTVDMHTISRMGWEEQHGSARYGQNNGGFARQ